MCAFLHIYFYGIMNSFFMLFLIEITGKCGNSVFFFSNDFKNNCYVKRFVTK